VNVYFLLPECCIEKKMDCESSFSSDCEKELEIIAAFVAIDEENKSTTSGAWVRAINEKRETLGELLVHFEIFNYRTPKKYTIT